MFKLLAENSAQITILSPSFSDLSLRKRYGISGSTVKLYNLNFCSAKQSKTAYDRLESVMLP